MLLVLPTDLQTSIVDLQGITLRPRSMIADSTRIFARKRSISGENKLCSSNTPIMLPHQVIQSYYDTIFHQQALYSVFAPCHLEIQQPPSEEVELGPYMRRLRRSSLSPPVPDTQPPPPPPPPPPRQARQPKFFTFSKQHLEASRAKQRLNMPDDSVT